MKPSTLVICVLAILCVGIIVHFSLDYFSYKPTSTSKTYGPETVLSDTDLRDLQDILDMKNKNISSTPRQQNSEGTSMGIYNGNMVLEKYWCSDVCPDNGIFFLTYPNNIKAVDCERVNGYKIYGIGWGKQFLGCSPTKNSYSK